jgi:hypothetical protein
MTSIGMIAATINNPGTQAAAALLIMISRSEMRDKSIAFHVCFSRSLGMLVAAV